MTSASRPPRDHAPPARAALRLKELPGRLDTAAAQTAKGGAPLQRHAAADMTMAPERLLALGHAWLANLREHARAAPGSDDPEHVHQIRSTLRRLRGLNRLLMQVCNGAVRPAHQAAEVEMRWLAGALGRCRNLDVLVGDLLPDLAAGLPRAAKARLRRAALQARASEREAARAVLAGSRFTTLLALCGAALVAPEVPAHAPTTRRIRRAWSSSVERLMRRAHKAARRPRHAGDKRLHALRIEVRKLRYLLEMGAPASGDGTPDKILQAASRLQSALGALQDLVVARELVATIAGQALAGAPAIAAALALEDAIARARRDALGGVTVAARRFRKLPVT